MIQEDWNTRREQFTHAVNDLIGKGYKLQGGPTCTATQMGQVKLIQALVLGGEEENPDWKRIEKKVSARE